MKKIWQIWHTFYLFDELIWMVQMSFALMKKQTQNEWQYFYGGVVAICHFDALAYVGIFVCTLFWKGEQQQRQQVNISIQINWHHLKFQITKINLIDCYSDTERKMMLAMFSSILLAVSAALLRKECVYVNFVK